MKILFRLLTFTFFSISGSSCGIMWDAYELQLDYLAPLHSIDTKSEYENTWNLSDIHLSYNYHMPEIIGDSGKIIVSGLDKGNAFNSSITALDSNSGEILWKIPGSNAESIIATGNVLYRGTVGSAVVYSHNIENGDLLWSTPLPVAHSTVGMYFAENTIFIYTGNSKFFLLNDQGEILDKYKETFRTFLELDGILYMEDVLGIKAVEPYSKKELWSLDLGQRYTHAPVFDDGEIFLRTWRIPTQIYSIDQYTGKVNWVISQDALSNLCLLDDNIYFTNPDSYLVAINRYSGNEVSRVKFSPLFDLDKQIGGYFVACDEINRILAVSFGDNTQIMGIKVPEP